MDHQEAPLEFSYAQAKHPFGLEIKTLSDIRTTFFVGSTPPVVRHEFFVLFHVTNGPGTFFVDFEKVSLQQGDTLFLRKGQVHGMGVEESLAGYALLFKSEFIESNRTQILQSPVFNHHLYSPLLKKKEAVVDLLPFFEIIYQEYETGHSANLERIIRSYLDILILKAEDSPQYQTNPAIDLRYYKEFNQFKDWVEANFRKTRNVKDVALAMGSSAKKINSLSRMFTDFSAKEFIDNRVILEIKRLLSVQDISVKELTWELGFEEPTNLIKYFKRRTGLTPRQFLHQS